MQINKPDLQSLLREAAAIPGVNVPAQQNKEDVLAKAEEITEYNLEDKWARVKSVMEGEFADRFVDEMNALSGREFIRVYSKMIEYFKPKIVRVETQQAKEEDRILRIEIHSSPIPTTYPNTQLKASQSDEDIIDITPE